MAVDIYQKVERDFGKDALQAHQLLEELDAKTKGLVSVRLVRSIVYLANGDIELLRKNIEIARTDWRDMLWLAEYDNLEDKNPARDFNKTFRELGLLR